MSTNVVFNGTTYSIPAEGESNWATQVSNYLIAIASGALQKSGGSFTLTAEVDFGATYGLKSAYFKSRGTNPGSTGIMRLANTESVVWRNAANNADLALKVNSSNLIEYNGNVIIDTTTTGTRVSPSAIVAGTGIAFTGNQSRAIWFIQGSGGAVTVSANPQIAAGSVVGQELILIGRNDTNTVTLSDGTGLSLNGPIIMGADSMISLIWDGTNWVERSRR